VREAGAEAIATGHTLDDQAETLLMRLARGSGIDGLSAMQPVSQIDALKLLRPLLGLPKARLEASLRARGLGWTVDPSNQNPSFERPRLRTLMPALIAAGLTPEAIATSARRLARGRAVLDQAAAQACRLFVGVHEAGYFEVDRHGFDQLAEDLRLRLLGRLLGRIGPPGAFERMARLELLMARLAAEPRLGLSLGGCLIQAGPDKILVLREPGREGLPRLTLSPGESADWDRRWRIDLSAGAPATIAVRALETADFQGEIAAAGKASGAPRKALLATPSAWSGSTLIAAPLLGLSSPEISFAALLSLDNLLAPRANDVATISEP